MKNGKSVVVIVITVVLSVLAIAMVGTASAKSLYVIAEHHTGQFDAYKINPDGTVTYQATYNLAVSTDPAGVAIDEDPEREATLFITSEGSNNIELVDATTMTSLGFATAPGASDLAGIDVDSTSNIVYTVDRETNNLYAYDWDSSAKTLILKTGYPVNLPNCTGAWGISLNETSGILYVADSLGGKVRGYNVTTWAEVQTFTPSQAPCDVAVDKQRGFIYTTAPDGTCAHAISGIDILVKIDIATGTETNVSLGHGSMGVAVDCATGLVYVTGGCSGDNLEVWNTTSWTKVQDTGVIGNPAGICIPQKEIEYRPTAVPILTPIGIIALVSLLSVIAAMSISTSIRKKKL